jgi:hypothetical protein
MLGIVGELQVEYHGSRVEEVSPVITKIHTTTASINEERS